MAHGHAVPGAGARRSAPTLRRGAAVVVITGGALALVAAATPVPAPSAQGVAVPTARAVSLDGATAVRSSVEPVAPDPAVVDAAELVKAVQLAEQQIARLEAERVAAAEQAAQEKAAQEKVAQEKVAARKASSRKAAAVQAAVPSTCGVSTSGLGAVKSHVRAAAEFFGCLFGEPSMHGVAGRAGSSDHPSGLAVDFMVDRATGDALAACALRNMNALGITYVIWEQRINHGGGWQSMEDRGGTTANHFDHVHISFGSRAGGGSPAGC